MCATYAPVFVSDGGARRPSPRFSKLLMEYCGGFFGLTAIVVYGNFWYDLTPYMAGASSCARADQVTTLLINACICLTMGTIAFLLEYTACHRGGGA